MSLYHDLATAGEKSPVAANSESLSITDIDSADNKNIDSNKIHGYQTHLPTVEPSTYSSRKDNTSTEHDAPTKSSTKGLRDHLIAPISRTSHITTLLLLATCLATGVNDAATFIDYHLFVSNQTGNTVFLAIGSMRNATFDVRDVGLSLACFLAGGLASGIFTRRYVADRPRARWSVILSNVVQTALTLAAAALRYWYATVDSDGPNHGGPPVFSVIALLGFASGLQVAMAKGLGITEIPTGMITTAWMDLVLDSKLWYFWRRNPPRDRRLAFILCILVGAFIGTAAHTYSNAALPLLLAGLVKTAVTVGFVVSPEEHEEANENEN